MKSVEFNKHQLEAYKNGAYMFIVPILTEGMEDFKFIEHSNSTIKIQHKETEDIIETIIPLQIGDEFFIKEEFFWIKQTNESIFKDMFFNDKIFLNESYDINEFKWEEASEMQEHQARYKDVVLDFECKRLQDLSGNDKSIIMGKEDELGYIQADWLSWLNKQDINHDNNPYIFLYKVKL